MSKVDLIFYFESTPPMVLLLQHVTNMKYRLKLDQKPSFSSRGKNRMVRFSVERIIETKRGFKVKDTGLNLYVLVSEWDVGIRKFLRTTTSKGYTVSMHGRKSNKEMKEEARKCFFGIKYRRAK